MDNAALGQKIKQQYPTYANVPDDILGGMIAKKFPAMAGTSDVETQQKQVNLQKSQIDLQKAQGDAQTTKSLGGYSMDQFKFLQTLKDKASKQAYYENLASQGKLSQEDAQKLADGGIFLDSKMVSKLPTAQTIKTNSVKGQEYGDVKSQIQGLLDYYNDIPGSQKGAFNPAAAASAIPFLGGAIGKITAPEGQEFESQRKGFSAILKPLVGAGQGSGVKINDFEMKQWANLLPSIHKTDSQNNLDVKQLDAKLKAKFGKGLDSQYLPSITTTTKSTPAKGGYQIIEVK